MVGIQHIKGTGLRSTHEITPPTGSSWHIKIRPSDDAEKMQLEADKISWAKDKLPVPQKAAAQSIPGVSLLLTRTIEGTPGFEMIKTILPNRLVAQLLRAADVLRATDVSNFPFDPPEWTEPKGVEKNLGKLVMSRDKHRELHPDFSRLTLNEIKGILDAGPVGETNVLSHGDWCMPNILVGPDGRMTGIVDLGGLHIGNENLDPAIMSLTLRANMGDPWEKQYLEAYSLGIDDQAVTYQRLIYDLGLEHEDPWSWIDAPELIEQRARLEDQ